MCSQGVAPLRHHCAADELACVRCPREYVVELNAETLIVMDKAATILPPKGAEDAVRQTNRESQLDAAQLTAPSMRLLAPSFSGRMVLDLTNFDTGKEKVGEARVP